MSVVKFMTRGGWAATAVALAASVAPADAWAESRNRGDRVSQQRADGSENNAMAIRGQRVQAANEARAARQAGQRPAQAERAATQAAGQGSRQGGRGGEQATRQGDRGAEQAARQADQRGQWRAAQADQAARQAAQRTDATQQAERNRSYADQGRNRGYVAADGERRGNDRGSTRQGSGQRGGSENTREGLRRTDGRDNNWQGGRRDNDGDNNRQGLRRADGRDNDSWRNDGRRWDRDWRNNNRYDWQRYRNSNRTVYRVGAYSAPYRYYSYRRYGVGTTMGSLFYGSSYWIVNPWQYRLPDVWGPYRWVRYYDDVLLVDIYTGQVVDVIYNFFW
ncbi:MAG TPA: RcnB family protein [Croceibacterium sp.]